MNYRPRHALDISTNPYLRGLADQIEVIEPDPSGYVARHARKD